MARRARRTPAPKASAAAGRLNAPFAELRTRLGTAPPPRPTPRRTDGSPPDDAGLFSDAMKGVRRLDPSLARRVDGPPPVDVPRRPVSEESEGLAALADLVGGVAAFDVTETREYVEGAVVGLDARVVRRLRRGDFAWQAHLDLHGLTAEPARAAVETFLTGAVRAGHRCVLIVHGRGLNSKDHTPVLKERLKVWLARGRMARSVLAFTTARPVDGGAGALYVLLRRDRRRQAIRVHEGTTS